MTNQRAAGNGNGEAQKGQVITDRSTDPLLDFPSIPVEERSAREKALLRQQAHEEYHGIRRYLVRPATRG